MSENIVRKPEFLLPKTESEPKVWGAWVTIGIGLAVGVISFLVIPFILVLVLSLLSSILSPIINTKAFLDNGLMPLASIATGVYGVGYIYFFVRLNGNYKIADYIGLRNFNWRMVLQAFVVFIIAVFLNSVFAMLWFYFLGFPESESNTGLSGWLPLLWIAVAVVAPIFEEVLFRGFIFVGLQRSRIGIVGTIIFTSLIWAMLHPYDLFGILSIVLLGIVFGVARYLTRSLWCTILVHIMWNVWALVSTMLDFGMMKP
ncbi:MAG: CPBP family intramembrane metalloprotease [Dehalococcoidia bacterium]|nr:CPBP family intramembrane metalloprotease [Dehalococcoidia bacterium]